MTFLPQFVEAHDPAASGKLFFLGAEFILISLPLILLQSYFAQLIADAFRRTKWVERDGQLDLCRACSRPSRGPSYRPGAALSR